MTESDGDGFALYNGVKLPDIDTVWTDKGTYPYAAIALIDGRNRALALWSMQASVTDTNLVYPAGMQLSLYIIAGSSWVLIDTTSYPDGSSDAPLTAFSAEWSSYDLMNTSNNTIYLAASDPIPLDGMNIIEWDGDTTGLTVDNSGYYYTVGTYISAVDALAVFNEDGSLVVCDDFRTFSNIDGSPTGWGVFGDFSGSDLFVAAGYVVPDEVAFAEVSVDGSKAYTSLFAYRTVEAPPDEGGGDDDDPQPPSGG